MIGHDMLDGGGCEIIEIDGVPRRAYCYRHLCEELGLPPPD